MSAREPEKPRFAPWEPPASHPPSHTPPSTHPSALARQRSALGFDDIPVAKPGEIEQEKKFSKWVDRQRITKFIKNKEYLEWKEDLKWALHADRGDEDHPREKHTRTATTRQRHTAPSQGASRPHFAPPPRPLSVPPRAISPPVNEASSTKTIDININFGSLPKPNFTALFRRFHTLWLAILRWLNRLTRKQRIMLTSGVSIAFVGVLTMIYLPGVIDLMTNHPAAPNTAGTDSGPSYATVLPDSKRSAGMEWHRVSPPESTPVYAYADTVDGVAITVSQQPIPDTFQPNIDDKVAELAKSYTATDKISASSTPIYVGTSSKGPQSVILTKDNLLILIKSASKVSDNSWAKYVESLH